ncbi:hypothetical protein [Brevibacterium aurantiacum]|uniref:hypothetical protein n=1 Tax=Brevibacterium aurantiacum TaxID=273384 RepID=UPI0010544618|nr:hypothetical protein [Brevibacterium aurantiacum]
MKKHTAVSPINIFGNIYAAAMLLLCVPAIFWMFQFFFLVPNLMPYFIVTLAVPALGLGVGLYGLWITRHDDDDEFVQDTSKEMH